MEDDAMQELQSKDIGWLKHKLENKEFRVLLELERIKNDYDAALDALQEMCRSHCAWRCGRYDPMGSQVAHDALEVLVKAGRLEWVGDESSGRRRTAKDKEA